MLRKRLAILSCAAIAALSTFASAAPITKGNLLIYRVGTGAAALGTTATAVFLDEYNYAGTLVQSIPVSATGSTAITATGNSATEGVLSLSQDGNSVVYTGYRLDAGGTIATGTNRAIGSVTLAGTPTAVTALTDVGGNAIRSATTVDGSAYYVSTAGAVRYVASPSATTSTVIDARNSRQVGVYGNILYASNGSTAVTGKVQTYGTLPTSTTTATPIVVTASSNAVQGFFLLDLSPTVAGPDTMYAIDTFASRLLKYSYDGTTWTAAGFSAIGAAQNITGYFDGTNVNLFLTSTSALLKAVDTTGYGGTLGTITTTSLATAATNTGFRGIAIIPEPSSLGLIAVGAPLMRRRRR